MLKGRAYQIKSMQPALLHALRSIVDRSIPIERHIFNLLEVSVRMETILDSCAECFKLPDNLSQEFIDNTFKYLAVNTLLRRHFDGIMLFHVTIKSHYLIHIAFSTQYWSPRLGWCYSGEDFVGRIKSLIAACHSGTPARLVVAKSLRRYCVGMGFNLMSDNLWREHGARAAAD